MDDPRALYDRVLAAYTAEGIQADVIGQWAIPVGDAIDLITMVRKCRPRSVLEVGTYVGVSTMLIALAGTNTTRIATIDPNLPLAVEMGSMGSRLGSLDASMRTHDVAAAVARRLGVSNQIKLLSGGFTSDASFASRRTSPNLATPVIGPDICRHYGPFDLAFIDGLHYADVVESDVTLASRHVSPDGVILMHDCVGMWGTNVRIGLMRFLDKFPDWRLLHPPLAGLYRSIGVLFRNETHHELESQLLRKPLLPPALEVQLQALATSITNRLNPSHVIELAYDEPIFGTKFDKAVTAETILLNPNGLDLLTTRLSDSAQIGNPSVLVVSAGVPDLLDDSQLRRLFGVITESHAVGVFLRTPAGEMGSACIHSRPLSGWVRIAADAGAAVGEISPLDLAPSKFLFTKHTNLTPDSSAMSNLAAIISLNAEAPFERAASKQLTIIDQPRADYLEQHDLLNVHYAGGFRSLFREVSELQRLLGDSYRLTAEHDAEKLQHLKDLETFRRQNKDLERRNAELAYQISGLQDMVEAALAHAGRHGHAAPCLMLSWDAPGLIIDELLADPRVGSVGVRDGVPTRLADRHQADSRVGRYFGDGNWSLPSPREVVYFIGSSRLLTPSIVSRAMHSDVQRLWIPVGFVWVRLPTQFLKRYVKPVRIAYQLRAGACHAHDAVTRLLTRAHDAVTRLIAKRSLNVMSVTASHFLDHRTLEKACDMLVSKARARSEFVPRRIVLVCGNLQPGGAERQVVNTLAGLAEAGMSDVLLLAHYLGEGSARHNFHLPRLVAAGVPAREIERASAGVKDQTNPKVLRGVARSLPADLVVDVANLVREFERLRPEVVHAWLDWDNVRAGLAAAIAGVPKIILSGRNLNPSHFLLYQPYMDPAYRALAALPNVTILNNSRTGAYDYADWIGIPRDRIKIIHNGVAFGEQRRSTPEAIAAAQREHGISDREFVVGGVFRFEEEKQPLLWLDVAALVRRAVPEARFLLFGQGSLHAAMEMKIRELRLDDRVIFAGVTDDPLAAMSLMNVFLLTSYGEGLPNVLLEAQRVGTPVVCTRTGGATEAIDPGVSGWVVDADKAEALADAVVNIHRNPDIAARAAARGPVFVQARFGMTRMIAETLDAYGMSAPYGKRTSELDVRIKKELSQKQVDA